jgi:hypothetical protein
MDDADALPCHRAEPGSNFALTMLGAQHLAERDTDGSPIE